MKKLDIKKTLEIIEQMKMVKVGDYSKLELLTKKLAKGNFLTKKETEYVSRLARIYNNGKTIKTKIFHIKLSEEDIKQPCSICGIDSLYYCNVNDDYFCATHVIGHDENEL